MQVNIPGHTYALDNLKEGIGAQQFLRFYMDPEIHGKMQYGTSSQEVLRALIDRIKYLNEECPGPENEEILYHLRQSLVLHESRAARRLLEKVKEPELLQLDSRGHVLVLT